MKKEKPIIYVDMDGVVADFDSKVKELDPLHEKGKDPVKVDKICYKNPNIFRTLDVIDGAVEGVTYLDKHFDVYFLSTPMWNLPYSYMDKRIWLEQTFRQIAYKKLVLTHNKGLLCNGNSLLIDDRDVNGAHEFALHKRLILFGTEYYPNWEAVVQYIKDYHEPDN